MAKATKKPKKAKPLTRGQEFRKKVEKIIKSTSPMVEKIDKIEELTREECVDFALFTVTGMAGSLLKKHE